MGTTGKDLNQILIKLKLPYYKGVYAADAIPMSVLNMPIFCIIVNTDLHNMEGMHWITLIKFYNHTKIFDSLQLNLRSLFPIMRTVFSYLKAKNCRRRRIQPLSSNMCGFYCIHEILKFHLLLYSKSKKILIKPFVLPKNNDAICLSNIKTMMVQWKNKYY